MKECVLEKPTLHIGQIGTGYIGKTHAIAYSAAPSVFDLSASVALSALADIDAEAVKRRAQAWGFARYTTDWTAIIEDPEIDIVDICTPNYLHEEMVLAAIEAGKAIYMEKPLALTYQSAQKLADRAREKNIKTLVGFNYIRNSAVQYAKQLIQTGVIGEVVQFRGQHNEDYMASAQAPGGWRTERKKGGSGALGDLGAHIINMAQFLVGGIEQVCGLCQQVVSKRPAVGRDTLATVENEDATYALVKFANGARGTLETSRVAWGQSWACVLS
jgi:predicted dehydrogenase